MSRRPPLPVASSASITSGRTRSRESRERASVDGRFRPLPLRERCRAREEEELRSSAYAGAPSTGGEAHHHPLPARGEGETTHKAPHGSAPLTSGSSPPLSGSISGTADFVASFPETLWPADCCRCSRSSHSSSPPRSRHSQKASADPLDGPPVVSAKAWVVTDAKTGQGSVGRERGRGRGRWRARPRS